MKKKLLSSVCKNKKSVWEGVLQMEKNTVQLIMNITLSSALFPPSGSG